MSRFPPLPPDQQADEQRAAHDEIDVRTQRKYGSSISLKNEAGALIGPFPPLLYTPTVALPWLNLADAVIHLPHLTERERELAVLATLSRTRAAYAVYAHTRLSLAAGLSEAQVSAALAGQSCASTSSASADALDSLSDSEKAVYEAALAMAGLQRPMGDEEFARIESALGGRERVGAVMHTVASFLYVSVVMNVAGVAVPGENNL